MVSVRTSSEKALFEAPHDKLVAAVLVAHAALIIPDPVQEEIAPGEASVVALRAYSCGAVGVVLAGLAVVVGIQVGGVTRVPF